MEASNGQVPVTVAEIHSNTSEMNNSYLETASNAPTAVVGGGADLSLEERLREVRDYFYLMEVVLCKP